MTLRSFALFCLIFLVIAVRYLSLPQPPLKNGDQIRMTATLKTQPVFKGNLQQFSLSGFKIMTWRYPEYRYGDQLIVTGIYKDDVLEFPQIDLQKTSKTELGGYLSNSRQNFIRLYQKYLPEPQASLLAGIVLGAKTTLPKDFREDLQKTGTVHIVVASGMNVSILAGTMFSFLLLFFSRPLSMILSFVLIWFYVVLVGGEPPIVRAGIMGSLSFLALGLGRELDAWRALGITAFLMLFLDPKLVTDLGFQLSFMATFGILFFNPLLSRWFKKIPAFLRSDLTQTLGAQIATLPIVLLSFGSYAPLSPLVNLLIVITLPAIMRLGLIGLLVPAILWLAYPFLTYIVKIVELFS